MTTPRALPKDLAATKPATDKTVRANGDVLTSLPFPNTRSFENASRGFIASIDPLTIRNDDGRPVFDLSAMNFLLNGDDGPPPSVNPSLWRQAKLNARHHGLYEVVDGIYQIRSFDISNMTLVRGDTGWIIIDPLTCSETSRAGLQLANDRLGARPVVAVIYTHSHADHFAGALGVMSAEQVQSGEIKVLAPADFVQEALSENVMAGNVMQRRAGYMYGTTLRPGVDGFVTTGLGAALSTGSTSLIPPNDTVHNTGETRTIDGIDIEFQMAMGSEAPSEFVFYFPQFKALCTSEITSHHLHNIYTPRGAPIRDARAWSAQIQEMIDRFGHRLEVQFASHHWPMWGRAAVIEFLTKQRDLYKYIHDQTLRLANHGYNKEEIAEKIKLPDSLGKEWHCRGYYGTVHHNVRAVYVKYLGFFDGNPANLHPLPPSEAGRRYVTYMGGSDKVVAMAREDFDRGEYRFVAEVLNHVVMAEPDHEEARALLADTLEQMGYQAESGPWRNFYLSGAHELRCGVSSDLGFVVDEGLVRGMPMEQFFEAMAVRLNGPKADRKRLVFKLVFEDNTRYLLTMENSVLHVFPDRQSDGIPSATTVQMTALDFKRLMFGLISATELVNEGSLQIDGDYGALDELVGLIDQFNQKFPIVTPREN